MTSRNRVPTIFSIYMLDVICCALGCVILLWQLKHGEAEEQTEAARVAEANWKNASSEVTSVHAEIVRLRAALDERDREVVRLSADVAQAAADRDDASKQVKAVTADLARTETERDEAKRRLRIRQQDYDKLRQAYQLAEVLLKNVRADLSRLDDARKLTAVELAAKVKANAELLLKVSAAEKKSADQAKQLAAKQLDVDEAAKRLQAQLAKLQLVEAKNRDLAKRAVNLQADSKETLGKLTVNELRIKMLEQELERSQKDRSAITALEGENAALLARAKAIQAEADQRFAGIALTGKNVLFLVDMSGSMAMMDENTADPDKWPLVCETVAQLMRSIKGLGHFQVLLFADKVRYPLGSPAQWLRYDPKATPQKALAALKATRPEGETNMHAVFAEAFRYREAGLDTIYLLSDGLPNTGGALLPGAANLSESKRTEMLSKSLRTKLKTEWNRPIAGQPRVRINSIGFFFESPDVGAFLWALSREHDGSFVGMSK